MAGGIRRNSRDSETEAIRAMLLSMQDEDLRVRDELLAEAVQRAADLAPLAEHVDGCRSEAAAEGSRPPAHPRSKDRDYQIWLRRVGWR